jgi:competence protein ComEC
MAVEDANDASVVLRVVYGEFSALLTGDAPASVEERLVDRLGRGLDADLLKVGHHGSSTSTSARSSSRPRAPGPPSYRPGAATATVIPTPIVLARLRQHGVDVYRTDRARHDRGSRRGGWRHTGGTERGHRPVR